MLEINAIGEPERPEGGDEADPEKEYADLFPTKIMNVTNNKVPTLGGGEGGGSPFDSKGERNMEGYRAGYRVRHIDETTQHKREHKWLTGIRGIGDILEAERGVKDEDIEESYKEAYSNMNTAKDDKEGGKDSPTLAQFGAYYDLVTKKVNKDKMGERVDSDDEPTDVFGRKIFPPEDPFIRKKDQNLYSKEH